MELTSSRAWARPTERLRTRRYGGANIIPLTVTGSTVSVTVTNLGNGIADSNFTATLSLLADDGSVRYVDLPGGTGWRRGEPLRRQYGVVDGPAARARGCRNGMEPLHR